MLPFWSKTTFAFLNKLYLLDDGNMKFETVKREVDKWDPVDLLCHAPSDEYDTESRKIAQRFCGDAGQDGAMIRAVFAGAFGEAFEKNLDECICIAKTIEENDSRSVNMQMGDDR